MLRKLLLKTLTSTNAPDRYRALPSAAVLPSKTDASMTRLTGVVDPVAIHAATERVLNDRNRLGLCARPLQETAVATKNLTLRIAGHTTKLLVNKAHGVAGDIHVADDYGSGIGVGHWHEAI